MARVTATESQLGTEGTAAMAVVEQEPSTAPAVGRVPGLDSLRFVLASWVVFGHSGFLTGIPMEGAAGVLRRLAFNGQAAVMVFFLISGFCIHLPYAHGRQISPGPFYLRREIRILTPVAGMFALGAIFKDFSFVVVLWSLVCEEVYYCFYPGLNRLIRSRGFKLLLALSVAVAIPLIAFRMGRHYATDIQQESYWLGWLECLPVWLLGAILADNLLKIRERVVPRWRVWTWRVSMWVLSMVAVSIGHHGIPLIYTDIPIGFLAYFWLRDEIAYFHRSQPPTWLEKLGLASYTLYLCHMLVVSRLDLSHSRTGVAWLIGIGLIAAFVAAFYFAVELPSHKLARAVGRRFERR